MPRCGRPLLRGMPVIIRTSRSAFVLPYVCPACSALPGRRNSAPRCCDDLAVLLEKAWSITGSKAAHRPSRTRLSAESFKSSTWKPWSYQRPRRPESTSASSWVNGTSMRNLQVNVTRQTKKREEAMRSLTRVRSDYISR
jgi:hypothetical protein